MSSDSRRDLIVTTEYVVRLGTVCTDAQKQLSALSFAAMSPGASSAATLSALATCVAPACARTRGVATRFGRTGKAVSTAAQRFSAADVLCFGS